MNRFGVEIELNSLDNRDFKNNPLNIFSDELPLGIEYVAHKLNRGCLIGKSTLSNSRNWILKPDGTCGIEVCTPILKGSIGLQELEEVIDIFEKDQKIKADDRCSFHIHIEVDNLIDATKVCKNWILHEERMFEYFPERKQSVHCRPVILRDQIDVVYQLIEKSASLSTRYLVGHLSNKSISPTIEVRIGDHTLCKDSKKAIWWTKLILDFFEKSINGEKI